MRPFQGQDQGAIPCWAANFMSEIQNLAGRLKAWREVNGYSREQAALALGVTASTVLRWEKGKAPRGLSKQALARALGNSDK